MNELQKQATKELEELLINHAETGRDREACYPSIKEEEEIGLLESVIDGCRESMQLYAMSKLREECRKCFRLDLDCIGEEVKTTKELPCFDSGPEEE